MSGTESNKGGQHGPDENKPIATAGIFELSGSLGQHVAKPIQR
jgi:hypothetical protein